MIEIESLTTGYFDGKNRIEVLDNVTATLNCGEYVCLLGPNGAGKSTLLRTLARFQPMLAGEIRINGRSLGDFTPVDLARSVGVVLTDNPYLMSMSAEGLVGIGRNPHTDFWGSLSDHDREVINLAISAVGIEDLRKRRVETLSDGERQKVMIAKALAQETDIILLDEPTAFLDFPTKVEVMRMLRSLAHERNKVIFQSTHDLNIALALADKIWLLDRKLGVAVGTPRELADSGLLDKYFEAPGLVFDRSNIVFNVSPDEEK